MVVAHAALVKLVLSELTLSQAQSIKFTQSRCDFSVEVETVTAAALATATLAMAPSVFM